MTRKFSIDLDGGIGKFSKQQWKVCNSFDINVGMGKVLLCEICLLLCFNNKLIYEHKFQSETLTMFSLPLKLSPLVHNRCE